MSSPLQFDNILVKRVEMDYSKIRRTPEMHPSIEDFAKLYTKFIPLSELAMRGFVSLTLREFQLQTHIEIKDFPKIPPAKLAKLFELIDKIMYEKLARVLAKPEQQQQLLAAIQEAHQAAARIFAPK